MKKPMKTKQANDSMSRGQKAEIKPAKTGTTSKMKPKKVKC